MTSEKRAQKSHPDLGGCFGVGSLQLLLLHLQCSPVSIQFLLSAFILFCLFLCFALSCLLNLSDRVLRIYWFLRYSLQGAMICHWSMVSSSFVVYLELRSATSVYAFSITQKHALTKIYRQRHRFWVVNNVIFDTPQLQRKIRTSRQMQLPDYISVPSAPEAAW